MVWDGVAVPGRHLWPAPTTEVRLRRFQGRNFWPTGPTWGLFWIGAPGQDGIGCLGGALRKFWGIPIQNAVPLEAQGLGQGTSYLDLMIFSTSTTGYYSLRLIGPARNWVQR